MKKFGLADGLGIVGVLVAVGWAPMLFDQLTSAKLLALACGGLFLAPFVVIRWRAIGRPTWGVLIPCAGVVFLVMWGVVSALGSGAPLWGSVLGWWGRGNGWLAWLGAAFLLLGAATLSVREVQRTISWLLGGATLVAIIGLFQAFGVSIPASTNGQVQGLMGNTNFAAGYFAIIASLALGRALTPTVLWQRIWAGALFACLAFLAWKTAAQQGPAALFMGVLALAATYLLLYRGRYRTIGLVSMGLAFALGCLALVMSFSATGPLAGLWAERSFAVRQEYWQTAIAIMSGQPFFGSGPDGFARFVSEYRPESFLQLLGPTMRVSAAHNIALQFGAALGYLGLVLWIVVFVGTVVALLRRILRAPVSSTAVTASVAGALTAYLVQGMVSIDMLPLLATGWLVAGLALACAREPAPVPVSAHGKKSKASTMSRVSSTTPIWVPITGGVLALTAGLVVGTQMDLNITLKSDVTEEQAIEILTDPKTPCAIRAQFAGQVLQSTPPDVSVPAVLTATDFDPRCGTMANLAAEALIRQKVFALAGPYVTDSVRYDPLSSFSWVLQGSLSLVNGYIPAAEAAVAEAQRLNALYPAPGDPRLVGEVQALADEIRLARERMP